MDLNQSIGLLTERILSDCEITKHWYDCIVAWKAHTVIEYEYKEDSGMYEDIPETPNSFQLKFSVPDYNTFLPVQEIKQYFEQNIVNLWNSLLKTYITYWILNETGQKQDREATSTDPLVPFYSAEYKGVVP